MHSTLGSNPQGLKITHQRCEIRTNLEQIKNWFSKLRTKRKQVKCKTKNKRKALDHGLYYPKSESNRDALDRIFIILEHGTQALD